MPKGFTLVEVLVTVVITCMVLLAVYGVFTSVSGAKQRLETDGEAYHRARVLFDRIGREIRSAYVKPSGTDTFFKGGRNSNGNPFLTLTTTTTTPQSDARGTAVVYYELIEDPEVKTGDKVLMRQETSPLNPMQNQPGYRLAPGIEAMSLRFYNGSDWQDELGFKYPGATATGGNRHADQGRRNRRAVPLGFRSPGNSGALMKVLRQESGMVLLLVLVVVTLLAALVTELAFSTLVDLRLTETFRDSTKAYYLAKGGVRAGRSILQRDVNGYDAPGDPDELWSQEIAQYPVGDGLVSIHIEDLGGKININALVNTGSSNVNPTVKDRVRRLFEILGISEKETLTAALIDWIDQDDRVYVDPETGRATGAETSYYLQREKPVRCKNGPLESLDELLLVRGFSAELSQRIAPYITLYGNDKINVNSASAEVLMALSDDPEITRAAAESIIAQREKEPFKTTETLTWINTVPGLTNLLRDPLQVTSSVYRIESRAMVNDGARQAEAIVVKAGNQLLYFKVD